MKIFSNDSCLKYLSLKFSILLCCFYLDQNLKNTEFLLYRFRPYNINIGGSKGAPGTRLLGPNSLIFMWFSAKNWKNNSTFGSWRTHLGENPGEGVKSLYRLVYSEYVEGSRSSRMLMYMGNVCSLRVRVLSRKRH